MSSDELTDRAHKAIANPITSDDGFDIHEALRDVLASAGLQPADSGGKITFIGGDPIVPSIMRLGAVPAVGLTAKSVALAALWRHRGGEGQDITMDLRKAPHRLCPFYDKRWELLGGYPGGTPSDPANPLGFDFYRTRDGRWVMPLNPYPKIKNGVYQLLRAWPEQQAVADAVAQWNATDLEQAGDEAGVVMPMLRTTEEFLREPACEHIVREPLIKIEKDVSAGRWHDAEVLALLERSDAIVLGCPTLMGSVSAVFKAFMEAAFTPFTTQAWKDKLAGVFTMSASQSGDKLTVLEQLALFAAQLGMQWIGVGDMPGNNWSGGDRDDVNRLGSWLGLMSQSHADEGPEHAGSRGDRITAQRYGERIARLTQRWVNAVPYETPRMTEHEARALSASLRDTDGAPATLGAGF